MIITKTWLNEWIDVEYKSLNELSKTLNSLGLEVDSATHLRAPDKVVIGLVKEKFKHEDSDKLNVTKVDIGSEILQIVCGAPNVETGQFVAVALKGAIMPNGMKISKAKLRGVESCGMICSSSELGFAKINDGIMVLDESIGKLELGKPLNEYSLFNDFIIEVELTPNRGDCLSIYGIARDLATVWNLEFKKNAEFKESDNVLGIGRVLRIITQKDINSLFMYRAIEIKNNVNVSLLMRLRLAQIELLGKNSIENVLNYATYSTGVLFNAYDFNTLSKDGKEITLHLNKDENGATKVLCDEKLLSVSGIFQSEKLLLNEEEKIVIIEANYTDPVSIALAKNSYKKHDENSLYRSFRGSEPNLSLGMNFLLKNLDSSPDIMIYSSSQHFLEYKENPIIAVNIDIINKIIGQEVHKDEIFKILKKLGFTLIVANEGPINVKVPLHRSDIKNLADICEEIVRIIGIDNITSKPLEFVETNRINDTFKLYKELMNLRLRAVSNGYFESLHYVLDNESELSELGFERVNLKLINPITNELNALRSTLLNHLLNAASFNIKNSKKIIKLFESGACFDKDANEIHHLAFIHCGFKEEAGIKNHAKPELVNFYDFLTDIKNIVGDFSLKESKHSFLSSFEQADIYIKGQRAGFVGRLHLGLENKKDLLKTYVCELETKFLRLKHKNVKPYSKFPSINRDLSVLIPKGYVYENIKNAIENLNLDILEHFKIVDIYSDENLKDEYSLTINFSFRNLERTLEDEEVSLCIDKILEKLKELELKLR
ncbi:phenylalanine--tRNA ligase subunit beta [Campylobacter sp. LR264d]|uniref:phenylalanine--tRNA ligase subunit beta n=1 Tax=Campylobacter sp. LR264d TaxID=2593544 RepID=UPI00123C65FF|nr:phenylalanine--tRNA ligase subunit beta [Campylobacter sp. LR264d]KAA6229573.1 phenylalanine--tRNA ligase subunit beta [Campylobacter sp. LR264d]